MKIQSAQRRKKKKKKRKASGGGGGGGGGSDEESLRARLAPLSPAQRLSMLQVGLKSAKKAKQSTAEQLDLG